QGKKAIEAHIDICEAYEVVCLTESTCENRFKIFPSVDFCLKDDQLSGRPTEVPDD
ncbi:hypothetical protein AVEN_161360-1, partial [Araneus ventricosus]